MLISDHKNVGSDSECLCGRFDKKKVPILNSYYIKHTYITFNSEYIQACIVRDIYNLIYIYRLKHTSTQKKPKTNVIILQYKSTLSIYMYVHNVHVFHDIYQFLQVMIYPQNNIEVFNN